MADESSLRIIEISKVSPPTGSVPATSIPLTFFDVMWLNLAPVERLFFFDFPHSTSEFFSSHLPSLKSSLAVALQSFFPLAGNIRLIPEELDRHELYYTDGDSVWFTIAESNRDFVELHGDNPREISDLKTLVPVLRKNVSEGIWPVLAIQVTVFPNRGIVVGITVHHSACDGAGSTKFMRIWGSICRMNSIEPEVIIDRSIIPDPNRFLYSTILEDFRSIKIEDFKLFSGAGEMLLTTFKLKEEHIKMLKEVIFREAEKRNITEHFSTIVVTYAFIWIGYIKAKSPENEESHCVFAVDNRKWFQPAIPESYFGNCIGMCFLQASTKDLMSQDGLFVACQTIRKAFEEVKREGINDAKNWIKNVMEKATQTPLSAAGSSRFRVYEVNFGWGKPVKVEMTSILSSGAMAVAESREEQGGIEVGLCFTKHELEVFKNYFEESLVHISSINKQLG